jgi:dihydroneopterin aldolase
MDQIRIHELEVFFRVGVPDAERAAPQRLLVSIELHQDISAAAAGDDLSRTIDYHAVAVRVRSFGDGREWRLIEALAVELAGCLLREFRPDRIVVEIYKFILPHTRGVSVRVERGR